MTRAVVCLAVLCFSGQASPAPAPAGRILVVPLDTTRLEPRLRWMSEASATLLADELNDLGLSAITRPERVRAFEQLHLPLAASLSRATVIKVGQLVGASEVVVGTMGLEGGELAITVESIRIDVGRLQSDLRDRAPLTDLFPLFERLARRLAQDAGRSENSRREPRPPLDAFEHYIKGLIADRPAAQATFLETAIRQFAGYDRARLALWEARAEQGNHAAALSAARGVSAGSRFERHARFLAGVSLLDLKQYDEAFDIFKGLLGQKPAPAAAGAPRADAAVLNNLGVLQIRRGATPQTGLATYYLTKAAEASPDDGDYLFNVGYAYVVERDNQGAIYWLREALRRNPADADAHYVLAAALRATGSTVEATREKDLARQLSAGYEDLERRAAADKLPVPKGLERVRSDPDPPRPQGPEQTMVNSAQREQKELAGFHLDRGRRFFEREEDSGALTELRRVVYLSPYEAQAHLLIGRIHLRGGRLEEAVDALKISIWSADTAPARVALAEVYMKQLKSTAARAELERALALDPASAEAKRLLAEIK